MADFEWKGEKVLARLQKAARYGVNRTMSDCVLAAKMTHKFKNRTGTAERSIRIVLPAQTGPTSTIGVWGSIAVKYFWSLEYGSKPHPIPNAFGRGKTLRHPGTRPYPTLRPAAKSFYPRLSEHIRTGWEQAGT